MAEAWCRKVRRATSLGKGSVERGPQGLDGSLDCAASLGGCAAGWSATWLTRTRKV